MSHFRLSQDIVPVHYDVSFEPDIPKKVYSARLLITFKTKPDSKSDHAELFADKSLIIHSIKQNGADLKYTRDESNSQFYIYGNTLNESAGPVEILFDGSLDHFTLGWYYVNDECCSTQFESSMARYLMPCFDEPCVKSTFTISITTLKHLTAYSNMPAASILTNEDGSKHTFTFHETPPMSCYLLALVIGDFDVKTGFTKRHRLPVDVIAPRGQSELMDEPLQVGIYAVDWLEDFLQVDFPLPRLQLIAVPEFQYGAMENFGLIIFRASCFLFKTGVTSLRAMYNCAITITHEIVHQWAGDCTSPKWWDSIWLNEGFASIIPYIILNEEFPHWGIMTNYHMGETMPALESDSNPTTHPICCEANSPEEIEALFDEICYSKASALIFMLMHHITLNNLRDALRIFYKRFYYSCANTDDLIGALSEVIKGAEFDNVKHIVQYWTKEDGYPLITFENDPSSPDKIGLLKQDRFTTSGIVELEGDKVWPIPLFILRKKKSDGKIVEEKLMFDKKTMSIRNLVEDSEWVKLNPNYKAFCRVWYRGDNLKNLLPAIQSKSIDAIERWSILYDSLSIARAGLMPYGDVIELLEAYSNEDEYIAASQITGFFSQLIGLFPTLKEDLQRFGKKILGGILQRIGSTAKDGESPETKQLRASILSNLAFLCNDKQAQEEGVKLFRAFKENKKLPENFDSNLIPFMMRCGAHFEKGSIDFLWDMVYNEKNPELQSQACISVGYCPIDENTEKNMMKSFDVKKQDVIFFFAGFSINPDIGDRFYNFFKANHQRIYDMFGGLAFNLPETFEYAAGSFTDPKKADDLEQFFKEHPAKVAEKTCHQLVERIRSKAKLAASQFESVKNALKNK